MNHQPRKPTTTIATRALATAAVLILLPGCYTRTVESRGLGTKYRAGQTYSPNLRSIKEGGGLLDGAGDLLIGPRTIEERQR